MSEMDCGTSEWRRHRKQKLLKAMMPGLIVVVLFASSLFVLSNPSSEIRPAPAGISYSSHNPIYISGNSQFTPANGVTGGTGTVANPYIISGWDINGASAHGIHILNTNAYFTVRDCYMHDSTSKYGIYLDSSVKNGILIRNTCSNNVNGIRIYSACDNNKLIDNNCSSNINDGIWLDTDSSNNTISNNTCTNNDNVGILLKQSSNYNTISNNICNSNGIGIWLDAGSSSNTVNSNTCSNNNCGIILGSSNGNTIINNDCSNNVNVGIDLRSSNYSAVSSNTCSNNNCGIRLDSSNGNAINNNNCSSNNNYGIELGSSSGKNIISWNQVRDNLYQGVCISSGSDNRVQNNTFIGNNGGGVQGNDAGTNNWWNSTDGYGNYWSDWTTPDSDFNGIVDSPYVLDGPSGAKDYYPLSSPPDDVPITIASSYGTAGTNGWFQSDVSVSLSATDSGSGVNTTFYRIGMSGSWLNYSSSFVLSSEGSSTVQFYSVDNASNNESVNTITIKIDKTGPTLTIDQTAGFKVTVDHVVISWIGSDEVSDIDHFEVSKDGGAFTSVGLAFSHNFTALLNGAYYVTVKAIDQAGHECNQSVQFTVDTGIFGGGIRSNLILFSAIIIAIIVIVIVAIVIINKRRKSPPMMSDEMMPESPPPPPID